MRHGNILQLRANKYKHEYEQSKEKHYLFGYLKCQHHAYIYRMRGFQNLGWTKELLDERSKQLSFQDYCTKLVESGKVTYNDMKDFQKIEKKDRRKGW